MRAVDLAPVLDRYLAVRDALGFSTRGPTTIPSVSGHNVERKRWGGISATSLQSG